MVFNKNFVWIDPLEDLEVIHAKGFWYSMIKYTTGQFDLPWGGHMLLYDMNYVGPRWENLRNFFKNILIFNEMNNFLLYIDLPVFHVMDYLPFIRSHTLVSYEKTCWIFYI